MIRRIDGRTVVVDRWVQPYLQLMLRMPGGPRAAAAVRDFVSRHGMRKVSR